jgi:hypothetical protein
MLLPLPELTWVVLDATLGRKLAATQARAASKPKPPVPRSPFSISYPPPGLAAPPKCSSPSRHPSSAALLHTRSSFANSMQSVTV